MLRVLPCCGAEDPTPGAEDPTPDRWIVWQRMPPRGDGPALQQTPGRYVSASPRAGGCPWVLLSFSPCPRWAAPHLKPHQPQPPEAPSPAWGQPSPGTVPRPSAESQQQGSVTVNRAGPDMAEEKLRCVPPNCPACDTRHNHCVTGLAASLLLPPFLPPSLHLSIPPSLHPSFPPLAAQPSSRSQGALAPWGHARLWGQTGVTPLFPGSPQPTCRQQQPSLGSFSGRWVKPKAGR